MTGQIFTATGWDSNGEASSNWGIDTGQAAVTKWYAIQTRLRAEKKVQSALQMRGTITFLPLMSQGRRWSDRRKNVTLPLFPGYVFARLQLSREQRVGILQVRGVMGLAGPQKHPSPIPNDQIEALQRLLTCDRQCAIRPFLHDGQRVRIRGGALDGVEGIVSGNGSKHLVIAIECIQRAISMRIDGYDLEFV